MADGHSLEVSGKCILGDVGYMSEDNVVQKLQQIDSIVAEISERQAAGLERRKKLLERASLRKQWRTSMWRFSVPIILAYVVTFGFYKTIEFLHVDEFSPSMRALGPALTVAVFMLAIPRVRRFWGKQQKRKGRALIVPRAREDISTSRDTSVS